MICNTLKLKTVNAKHNHSVHALTNRRGNFNTNIPIGDWFTAETQEDYWYQLQSGLYLDREVTDYYLYLALTILNTYEDISELCASSKLTFDLGNISVLKPRFLDGGFTSVGRNLGGFTNYSDVMPIPERYTITYKTDKQLLVLTDVGRKYVSTYSVSKRGTNSVLLVDWHNRLPMKGPMLADGIWGEASSIEVEYVPYGINYKQWLEYIEAKMDVLLPLDKTGLTNAYTVSSCHVEKLALLVASLALLNSSESLVVK